MGAGQLRPKPEWDGWVADGSCFRGRPNFFFLLLVAVPSYSPMLNFFLLFRVIVCLVTLTEGIAQKGRTCTAWVWWESCCLCLYLLPPVVDSLSCMCERVVDTPLTRTLLGVPLNTPPALPLGYFPTRQARREKAIGRHPPRIHPLAGGKQ